MELPTDKNLKHSCTLDKFAKRAVSMLPPPPKTANSSAQWWGMHREFFTKFFTNFGTAVIVSGQIGGMVELYSTYSNSSVPEATLMAGMQLSCPSRDQPKAGIIAEMVEALYPDGLSVCRCTE